MDASSQLVSILGGIGIALYLLLVAVIYLGIVLTATLRYLKRMGRTTSATADAKEFREEAQNLLRTGEYSKLKELAWERERRYPGDAELQYLLGMAYFRCKEYVDAKAHFAIAMDLDGQWKKACSANLAEIETALKNIKPSVVP